MGSIDYCTLDKLCVPTIPKKFVFVPEENKNPVLWTVFLMAEKYIEAFLISLENEDF